MSYSTIGFLLCFILRVEALLMLPCLGLAVADGDQKTAAAFGAVALFLALFSLLGGRRPTRSAGFYARDGLVTVGLAWVLVSVCGALPFVISGEIPAFVDALFESVSGFTTTGASILPQVEGLPRALLLWRSISHFAGGMGVLVFLLAVVPMAESSGGGSLYLLRAESTGPQVGKLLPKMRDSAKVLYAIYVVMTFIMIALLLLGGEGLLDSINLALSTAGTGGFGIRNDSMASFGAYTQTVVGVFMTLFGINFSVFYLLLIREFKKALFNEELRAYLGIMAAAVALVAANLVWALKLPVSQALGQAAFQASSLMTSTGFTSADFNLWPEFSKVVLLILMMVGACAGSTGGGIKVVRVVILAKSARNNLRRTLRPRQVNRVRMDGAAVEEETVQGVLGYMVIYALVAIASFLLISLDNFSMESNLSAVVATLNNTGPGLDAFGPMSSYAAFSPLSKLVLTLNMLVGRLEIFPILLLFSPGLWRRST